MHRIIGNVMLLTSTHPLFSVVASYFANFQKTKLKSNTFKVCLKQTYPKKNASGDLSIQQMTLDIHKFITKMHLMFTFKDLFKPKLKFRFK